ncbi:MAG: 30S ribosomal protein S13 [Candidatus Pacearchaeota archaeon]|nr:30S ribosomal protein S13 [Candidatus Pacearchaeota archaeon]
MANEENNNEGKIIRILAKDIEGKMTVYSGLTKIKGISWGLSNAICNILRIDKKRKISSLSEEELQTITEFVKSNKNIPKSLLNRRKDFETGEDKHLVGSDLELQKEFDIKRLKKIKSYRGLRHMSNLPLRGQRTKSNFRRNRRKGAGIKKKNKGGQNEKKA